MRISDWSSDVCSSDLAEVLGKHAQPLVLTALGGSPGGTVAGEVVRFADLDALKAAPDGSLAGKLAFVDYQLKRRHGGADYHNPGGRRWGGPYAALRHGAQAFLLRPAGTAIHRPSPTHHPTFYTGEETNR